MAAEPAGAVAPRPLRDGPRPAGTAPSLPPPADRGGPPAPGLPGDRWRRQPGGLGPAADLSRLRSGGRSQARRAGLDAAFRRRRPRRSPHPDGHPALWLGSLGRALRPEPLALATRQGLRSPAVRPLLEAAPSLPQRGEPRAPRDPIPRPVPPPPFRAPRRGRAPARPQEHQRREPPVPGP